MRFKRSPHKGIKNKYICGSYAIQSYGYLQNVLYQSPSSWRLYQSFHLKSSILSHNRGKMGLINSLWALKKVFIHKSCPLLSLSKGKYKWENMQGIRLIQHLFPLSLSEATENCPRILDTKEKTKLVTSQQPKIKTEHV